MNLQTIEQGQRDWLTSLNTNITNLSKNSETTTDIVYENGWKSNGVNKIVKIPLLGGDVMKVMVCNITIDSLNINNDMEFAKVPEECGNVIGPHIGGSYFLLNPSEGGVNFVVFFTDATTMHINTENQGTSEISRISNPQVDLMLIWF